MSTNNTAPVGRVHHLAVRLAAVMPRAARTGVPGGPWRCIRSRSGPPSRLAKASSLLSPGIRLSGRSSSPGRPALLVFVVPGIPAVILGRKARRLWHKDGNVAAIVGAALGGGFVAINVASYLLGLVVG